jgi:hypothetical protein
MCWRSSIGPGYFNDECRSLRARASSIYTYTTQEVAKIFPGSRCLSSLSLSRIYALLQAPRLRLAIVFHDGRVFG